MSEIHEPLLLSEFVNAIAFANYACNDPNRWDELQNTDVFHKSFGRGRIIEKIIRDGLPLIINISFDELPEGERARKFQWTAFVDGYFSIPKLPPDTVDLTTQIETILKRIENEERLKKEAEAEKIRLENELRIKQEIERQQKEKERLQKAKEEEATKQFVELKNKYHITDNQKISPTSPLFMILLKIESNERLVSEETSFLEKEHHYSTLAIVYEKRYHNGENDPWNLIKAGKYWRKANKPEFALSATKGLTSNDPQVRAAIATNRGGAYRDLSDLEQAEKCGRLAISIDKKSYFACNLLGAIYYQIAEPEKGEEFFKRAIELGASPGSQDHEIHFAIEHALKEDQLKVAQYLLTKDPKRYGWAKYYLDRQLASKG